MEESINQIEKIINSEISEFSMNPLIIKNCFLGICNVIKSQSKLIHEISYNKKGINSYSSNNNYFSQSNNSTNKRNCSKSPERDFKESIHGSNYQLIKFNSLKIESIENLLKEIPKHQDLIQLKVQLEQKHEKEMCNIVQSKISYEDIEFILDKKVNKDDLSNEVFKLQSNISDIQNKYLNNFDNKIRDELQLYTQTVDTKINDYKKRANILENKFNDVVDTIENCQKTYYSKVDKKELDHILTSKIEPDYQFLKNELSSKTSNLAFIKLNEDINRYIDSNNALIEKLNGEIHNNYQMLNKQSRGINILEKKFNQQIDTICADYSLLYGNLSENLNHNNKILKEVESCIEKLETHFSNSLANESILLRQNTETNVIKLKDEFVDRISQLHKEIAMNNNNFNKETDYLRQNFDQQISKIPFLEQRIDSVFDEIDNKINISSKLIESKIKDNDDRLVIIGKIQETQGLLQLQENQIQTFNKKLETVKNQSLTYNQLDELEKKIDKKLEQKALVLDLTTTSEKMNNQVLNESKKLFKYLENSFKVFEQEIQTYVQNKINEKSQKAENNNIENLITQTKFDSQFDNKYLQNTEKHLNSLLQSYMLKEDYEIIKEEFNHFKENVEINFNKLNNREDRTNLKDLNDEIALIKSEINKKCSLEFLDSMIESQTQINDFLCSENCLGRWLWNSGKLNNNCLVPWEYQIINTVPENYFWEKNQHTIIILSKGLYHVQVGCFSNVQKTKITLNLNGEVLLSNHKKLYQIDEKGNIMSKEFLSTDNEEKYNGCTINEVITLPTRSRISVSVYSEGIADGFFSIKKL